MGRLVKNAFPQSVNARRSHTLVSYFHIENILDEISVEFHRKRISRVAS
jgi:hypothetical protein